MSGQAEGRYQGRLAADAHDLDAIQNLRALCFRGADGGDSDRDQFDDLCQHFLVMDRKHDQIVCCFRVLLFRSGQNIENSYAAQFYDLKKLCAYPGPMIEMGRFCISPENVDSDILRVAWGALAQYVDENGVELLFGCSSFQGTNIEEYRDAFAMLKEKHLAPEQWLPKIKAPRVFPFAHQLRQHKPQMKNASKSMPPLLRTYLMMGGWVSDHAVVDYDLNTLHVFTGLEVSKISPARRRLLLSA